MIREGDIKIESGWITNIIQKEIYKPTKNIGISQNQKLLIIALAST